MTCLRGGVNGGAHPESGELWWEHSLSFWQTDCQLVAGLLPRCFGPVGPLPQAKGKGSPGEVA